MTRNNVFYIFKRIISVILTMSVLLMMTPVWSLMADSAEVTHDHSGWQEWTDPTSLPAKNANGSYYLTTDVTLSGSWVAVADFNLCLNGHTITSTSDAAGYPTIDVGKEGGLNIYDCQNTGEVTRSNGPTILVESGGTVNIYGGTIKSTVAESTAAGYAAIQIRGTATINGGKFEANGLGTTIYGEIGSKTIIIGGEFSQNDGGNVIQNYGTLEMSGCTVNGISSNNRGVVGILNSNGGTATIENVTVTTEGTYTDDDTKADKGLRNDSGGTMTVKNCNITSSNRAVWNTGGSTIKISSGTFNGRYGMYNNSGTFELSGSPTFTGSIADIYLSDDQKITVTGTLGNAAPYSVLTKTAPTEGSPVVFTTGATTYNDTTKFTAADSNYAVRKNSDGQLELAASEHTHDDIILEPWTDTERLPDSGSYYLENDVTLSSSHILSGSLTLCLNGHTITYDKGLPIQVKSGRTLGIYDCQDNGAVTTTADTYCIRIFSGGTANIYGGTFNGSNDANYATIYVEGTVTIENASVFSQQPVQIWNGGMGTINGGTFESTDKPTIDVQTNASLKITDGTFIRNSGGNIIQNQGTLEMSGGTITGRSSSSNGAVGIVNHGGKTTIKNVTINTEGTYIDDDTLAVKADKGFRNDGGGTMIVENCDITSSNWAVWNTGNSKIIISGGTFKGRYGMYNNNGTFELSGSPTFTGSIADIYLSSGQKITVTGTLGNAAPYSVLTADTPTEGNPVVITNSGNTNNNNASKFTSVDGYTVRKNSNGQLELALLATYTITYDKGTPSNVTGSHNADTVAEGESVTLPGAVFTRTGYTQTGWATSDGGAKVYELNETFSPNDNITLYPFWTIDKYTVTFDYNGATGDNSTEKKEVTYDSTYGTLPTPTKTGYTFDGWFTAASGGSEITSDTTVTSTESHTLYAHWTAETYTVTFDYQGATSGYETSSITVTYDSTYGDLPTPKKTGLTFGGWFTEKDGKGTEIKADTKVKITAAQTLYASWIECQHEDMKWTADQDGEHHSGTCDNCGKSVTDEHHWNDGEITREPTAETDGEKLFTCIDCKTTYTEVIPKHEHVFDGEWKYDEESHWQECSYDNIKGNQADHSWNSGTVTKEATSTEKGVKTYECTVCKATKTEDIPATGSSSGGDNTGGDNSGGGNNNGGNTGGSSGGNSGGTSRPSTGTTIPSTGDSSDPSDNTSDPSTGDNNDPSGDTSVPSTGDNNDPSEDNSDPSAGDNNDPSGDASDPSTGDNTDPSDGNDAGNVNVDSASGESAPDVTISEETSNQLKDEVIASHLTPEEKAAVENGADVDIILSVEDAGDSVPTEDRQVTEAVLTNTEYTLGMYLNIDLIKLINGHQVGKITEINSPINVIIEIPEALRGENRAFAIVRIHDGIAEILEDTDNDPDTITIVTDRFSTYAIVYQDTSAADSGNPNTGVTTPIAAAAIACAVTVAAVTVKKKELI